MSTALYTPSQSGLFKPIRTDLSVAISQDNEFLIRVTGLPDPKTNTLSPSARDGLEVLRTHVSGMRVSIDLEGITQLSVEDMRLLIMLQIRSGHPKLEICTYDNLNVPTQLVHLVSHFFDLSQEPKQIWVSRDQTTRLVSSIRSEKAALEMQGKEPKDWFKELHISTEKDGDQYRIKCVGEHLDADSQEWIRSKIEGFIPGIKGIHLDVTEVEIVPKEVLGCLMAVKRYLDLFNLLLTVHVKENSVFWADVQLKRFQELISFDVHK